MEYVDLNARVGDLSGVLDPSRYLKNLPSIAADLPPGARAFATDTDHYTFPGRRCVKDLTLDPIRGSGSDGGDELEILFRHNCWKHDDDLVIRYTGVSGYVIDSSGGSQGTDPWTVILDEILPDQNGCSHEIACWEGTLTVVCSDLRATWVEALCPSKP
ncbi:hypothetical protein ABZ934_23450 [Streptomyces sp. NPDC046557]|uniref:hypothetical protein n=1 Tax=Streptomyces sp. NPDC046557 TaxID=3155372 RepID=UPI0033F8F190